MAPRTRAPRRASHAKHRRLQQDRARRQRAPGRAQRHLQALEPAVGEVGVAETRAAAGPWRLQAVRTRRGQIVGLRCPTVVGCRTHPERPRVRAWDQHRPARLVGALPTPKGRRPLPHRGPDLVVTRWHAVGDHSPATRRRWPWTWVGDDRGCKQAGPPLGLVGPW